jgi:hypothetical protein
MALLIKSCSDPSGNPSSRYAKPYTPLDESSGTGLAGPVLCDVQAGPVGPQSAGKSSRKVKNQASTRGYKRCGIYRVKD